MFKNVEGTGKTFVHTQSCEHLGDYKQYASCKLPECGRFHAAESMRSGAISMLRKGLATLGLAGDWGPEEIVPAYAERRTRKGRVTQKSEALLMRDDIANYNTG